MGEKELVVADCGYAGVGGPVLLLDADSARLAWDLTPIWVMRSKNSRLLRGNRDTPTWEVWKISLQNLVVASLRT